VPPPTPSFMASAEEEGVAFSLVFSFAFYLSFPWCTFHLRDRPGRRAKGSCNQPPVGWSRSGQELVVCASRD